jgi:hypothetical protein
MLLVFKGEILANMTQVSDVAPGPLVSCAYILNVFNRSSQKPNGHKRAQIYKKFSNIVQKQVVKVIISGGWMGAQ